jgi:hypothetical protein
VPGEDVPDGGARHADDGGQAVRPEAVCMAGGENDVDSLPGQGARHPVRPGGPVLEPRLALGLEPVQPLPGRLAADARHVGRVGNGHPFNQDPVDQQPAAERRQLGPTMCHESLPSDVSWIPTTERREALLVKNLFVNHS